MMKSIIDREELLFSPPEAGSVLYLPGLPGGGAIIYDRSPYGNKGIITGAIWKRLPSGLWCLDFDGVDNYVKCGNGESFNITEAITLSTWVRPNGNVDTIRGLFGAKNGAGTQGYWLDGESTGHAQFWLNHVWNNISSTTLLLDEVWYHLVATYQSDDCCLYVNGNLEARSTAYTGDMTPTTNDINIGWEGTGSRYWKGNIALPRIRRRTLSAREVANEYHDEKFLFGVW